MQKGSLWNDKSTLLFFRKLREDLEKAGFIVNPYNPCTANKMVIGSQMVVTRHVNELKIIHTTGLKITNMIKLLDKIYVIF